METIVLSDKKQLDIYVNPQRQKLLRCMKIAGVPMTPKQIADKIGISASAVQHHIKKLVELGVVELSHTEQIHGITASFYAAPPKTVSIGGLIDDGNTDQRIALMQNSLSTAFTEFTQYCKTQTPQNNTQHGDMLNGVIHLTQEEAKELYGMIREFLDTHEQKQEDTQPWEYTIIAYPATEKTNA